MKTIPLTQGQVALVDDEDFERINAHKWFAQWDAGTCSFYGTRHSERDADGIRSTILMHREVTGAQFGKHVDHQNHNTLDNQRTNLRVCSHSQNLGNRRINTNNTSGYKGVSWYKRGQRWHAQIRLNGKDKHLGYFDEKSEAAHAYDVAAIQYFGEFALTNEKIACCEHIGEDI